MPKGCVRKKLKILFWKNHLKDSEYNVVAQSIKSKIINVQILVIITDVAGPFLYPMITSKSHSQRHHVGVQAVGSVEVRIAKIQFGKREPLTQLLYGKVTQVHTWLHTHKAR